MRIRGAPRRAAALVVLSTLLAGGTAAQTGKEGNAPLDALTVADPRLRPAQVLGAVDPASPETRSNNTPISLSDAGSLTLQAGTAGTVHLILDVYGYFQE